MSRVRLLAVLAALVVFAVPPAAAVGSSGVVISQVFGGGGNAGAPYASDFVELFNRGSAAVDMTGWTLQYATAAGTSWSSTPLAGTIQPGKHLLVALAGGTVGAPLPTPDVTGATNVSATSGKVALVRTATELTCGATPGSCAGASVVDFVGYGAATDYEGAGAAPALTSTTAVLRGDGGCADTDVSSADFTAAAPAPRSSASAASPCATTPPPTGSGTSAPATVDVDVQSALAVTLERPSLSFGNTVAGATPAPLSERVTVVSNHAAGYALSVQRTAFAPADLPLAIQATAPPGGQLGSSLGTALTPIPIVPSSLTIGTTSSTSSGAGDVWPTTVGFSAPLPSVAAGRYTATLTFTVIGR